VTSAPTTTSAAPTSPAAPVSSVIATTTLTFPSLATATADQANASSASLTARVSTARFASPTITATQSTSYAHVRKILKIACNFINKNIIFRMCLQHSRHGQGDWRVRQEHWTVSVLAQRGRQKLRHHWKIASGFGCELCNCDPVGAISDQCNQVQQLSDLIFLNKL